LVGVLAGYSKQARYKIAELSTVRDALDRIDAGEIRRSSAPNDRPSQRHFVADRLTPKMIGKLMGRYRAGDLLTTLAADYGISRNSVRRLLKARGMTLRSRDLTDQQKADILQLRQQGMIIRDIAKWVGCSYDTARIFLLTRPSG
jgi:AraC-like DNA-binding protein